MNRDPLLSIAIICKNEERHIRRCLDSVLSAAHIFDSVEVLLIDSFSTDGTIEIAKNYPIKIIRLKEGWPHSPAAGRYTAFRLAKGEFTLSIDGDMELMPRFLPQAIPFMQTNRQVAGITGIIEHVSLRGENGPLLNIDRGELIPLQAKRLDPKKKCFLKSIPGCGLFRTSAVRKVGNFHPFLRAEEEYELCQRLRKANFKLCYLPIKLAIHYGYDSDELSELTRRLRNGFITGIGQMFKWSMTHGFLKENAERFAQHLIIGGYILAFPPVAFLSLKHVTFVLLWAAGLFSILGTYVAKKKHLNMGLVAFLTKALIGLSIYAGLFVRIKHPALYPTDPIILDLAQELEH